MVERGQHVVASTVQRVAEIGDSSSAVGTLRRSGSNILVTVDLPRGRSGCHSGDDALVDQPRDFEREVLRRYRKRPSGGRTGGLRAAGCGCVRCANP